MTMDGSLLTVCVCEMDRSVTYLVLLALCFGWSASRPQDIATDGRLNSQTLPNYQPVSSDAQMMYPTYQSSIPVPSPSYPVQPYPWGGEFFPPYSPPFYPGNDCQIGGCIQFPPVVPPPSPCHFGNFGSCPYRYK